MLWVVFLFRRPARPQPLVRARERRGLPGRPAAVSGRPHHRVPGQGGLQLHLSGDHPGARGAGADCSSTSTASTAGLSARWCWWCFSPTFGFSVLGTLAGDNGGRHPRPRSAAAGRLFCRWVVPLLIAATSATTDLISGGAGHRRPGRPSRLSGRIFDAVFPVAALTDVDYLLRNKPSGHCRRGTK